jgi:hypothetical protein
MSVRHKRIQDLEARVSPVVTFGSAWATLMTCTQRCAKHVLSMYSTVDLSLFRSSDCECGAKNIGQRQIR